MQARQKPAALHHEYPVCGTEKGVGKLIKTALLGGSGGRVMISWGGEDREWVCYYYGYYYLIAGRPDSNSLQITAKPRGGL